MTACISTFMCHNRWDADHCPCVEREPNWAPQPELDASVKRVTSVSLVTRGRPCRTAGDDHHAISDRTHCGTWNQFPVPWHHAVAAHHWTGRRRSRPRRTSEAMNTNMPRSLCKSLAVMFGSVIQCWWTDWTFRRIFGRGATVKRRVLNCIPMYWKSYLVWDRTSRSWWSSQETGAPWWLSGRAVEPVPEYLPWSASRLSRRVASHLAALFNSETTGELLWTWWTLVEKSPVQTKDKWTGTPSCWPRNADTCGQPDASEHEGRHRLCLSIPSTPDFWWLIRRTLASPSWSVELPCGVWEWTGRLQVADLLFSWAPGTTDCRILGTSRLVTRSKAPFISKALTACLRSWRLFLVRKLMLWWVSWGRCWNAMPIPSSTMPVVWQLPSRLHQCGAKSARRAPTWDPSTLSGCGRQRSFARLLAHFLEASLAGPAGASSKGRLLRHSPPSLGGWGPQAVKDWSSRSRLLGWRHFRAGLGLSMLLGESHRRASHPVSLPDGTYMVLKDLWFGTHHMATFKRCRPHRRKDLGLEAEILQEGIATKQLQVRRGCKACRDHRNLCFLNYGQLLPEKFRAFLLGREFFYYRCHHRVR